MIVAREVSSHHPADLTAIKPGEHGYARQKVSHCIVFGAQGQFISLDKFVDPRNPCQHSKTIVLPEGVRQEGADLIGFLWNPRLRPQARERVPVERLDERTSARHQAVVAFHRDALNAVADVPLRTFLKFLECWTPGALLQALAESPPSDAAAFVYRFQYDDELLHERHAARLAWQRLQVGRALTVDRGRDSSPPQRVPS